MKKILFSVILALTATMLFAQNQSQHLSFKGVPIDGTLNEYVAKMKQSGFTLISTKDGVAKLRGDFAAYKNCSISIVTKGKDLVSEITVIFPAEDRQALLLNNYFSLKEMLTEKYGEPSKSGKTFDIYSSDDIFKMHDVVIDGCKYITVFSIDKGDIQLSIKHSRDLFVVLSYFDKINGDIIQQKAMDDL
jgi:hypothetical protein